MSCFAQNCNVNDIFVDFQAICSNKNDIYAKCRLLDRPINLIVYLKCYHVKYTDFSSISYLDTFSSWCCLISCFAQTCKVNDIFVHFRISVHINTIFMHNVDLKSDPYTL